jgi:formiminotetrahydrofolate cyclodeaminase
MICRLCFEGIKLCPELITKGNVNLISDVAVAAIMLESAFASGRFNVEINLKSLADKNLTRDIRKELIQKEKQIRKIRLQTEEKVGKIIRG